MVILHPIHHLVVSRNHSTILISKIWSFFKISQIGVKDYSIIRLSMSVLIFFSSISLCWYHAVIFHFLSSKHYTRLFNPDQPLKKYHAIWRTGLFNPDPPLKKYHVIWCQYYPSQCYFGNSSSPSISRSGFSIQIRLSFALFKNM